MAVLQDLPNEILTNILLHVVGRRLSYRSIDLENILRAYPIFKQLASASLELRDTKTLTMHQRLTLQVAVSVVEGKLVRKAG